MKKSLLAAMVIAVFLSGCGQKNEQPAEEATTTVVEEAATNEEETVEEVIEEEPEPEIPTEIIKRIKSEKVNGTVYEYVYDEDGKLIEAGNETYEYDDKGRVASKKVRDSWYCGNPECTDVECLWHGYLMYDPEVSSETAIDLMHNGYNLVEDYEYDSSDNMIKKSVYQFFAFDENYILSDIWEYEYDSKNRVISKKHTDVSTSSGEETPLYEYQFEYDDNDNVVVTRCVSMNSGNVTDERVNEFDESGRMIKGVLDIWDESWDYTYEYDGDDFTKTSEVVEWNDGWDNVYDCYFVETHKFDEDGDLIYLRKQKVVEDPEFSYDSEDTVTEYEFEKVEVEIQE